MNNDSHSKLHKVGILTDIMNSKSYIEADYIPPECYIEEFDLNNMHEKDMMELIRTIKMPTSK